VLLKCIDGDGLAMGVVKSVGRAEAEEHAGSEPENAYENEDSNKTGPGHYSEEPNTVVVVSKFIVADVESLHLQ